MAESHGAILIVDDTVENLRLLSTMLGKQGYEVRPVTNGRQALQAALHAPPDLILLDINMPEMSGYEVCEHLKKYDELKEIPVIFLTALNEMGDKIRAFEVGGVDYITKPFQIEEVMARVNAHVVLRQMGLELAKNYSKLQTLEQLRDDLVHMVVHDLRSPLGALIGRLELLQSAAGRMLDHESAADLRAALESAEILRRMTNDLLDVSRLESGQMPLVRSLLDLPQIAERVRSALGVLDQTRSIEVIAGSVVEISGDANIVQRVLENLVSNAIKHTPRGGRIQIAIRALENGVRVTVEDEGPGVPLEARTRVFEKFGTVLSRMPRAYHSVGLGLAFCKLAVEAHGGTIGIENGQLKGSAFFFELPCSSPSGACGAKAAELVAKSEAIE